MSTYLYRLGRFAARRAWVVLAVWAILLAAVGGAAGLLSKPFSSQLSVPGTEFQRVLDDLQVALPESSGGSGTVVLRTRDGKPFTTAQKATIADAIAGWKKLPGVTAARDPFETQRSLDDAATKVADGKKELADGRRQIATNTKKLQDAAQDLDDGQDEIDANAKKLADGKTKLAAGESKIADGQAKLDSGAAKLADGKTEVERNAAKLDAGQRSLDANADKLADGKAQLARSATQLAQGRTKLEAGAAKLAEGRTRLDAAKAAAANGRKQLAAATARLDAARAGLAQERAAAQRLPDGPERTQTLAKLDARQAQLDAGARELEAQQATLDAAATQLAAQEKQLVAGEQQLAASRRKLGAGEKQLAQGRARLANGQAQLDAGRTKLADGARRLDAGRAALSNGERRLAQGQATLSQGAATAAENAAKLAAGEAKLDAGRTKLADGRAQVADGRRKLAQAQAKLATGAAALRQGERRLALIQGMRTVSRSGATAVATVSFDTPTNAVDKATLAAIPAAADHLAPAGVVVDYSKDFVSATGDLAGPGEAVGLAIAGIVLLVMLGSLLAAGLPLLTALVGVGVGLLGVLTATHWFTMTDVTPMLALMLGLAVGIDYALFLVNRHREQLADGLGVEESIGRATGTAGSAVTVAGMTVVVALAALTLSGIPFLGAMGLAAAATVAVAVLVSLTLTPACLSLMGTRVISRRARRALRERAQREEADADALDEAQTHPGRPAEDAQHGGWGGLVTRHPVAALVVTTLALLALAVPAASLRLGLPDGGTEPSESSAYRAYSTISQEFGAGQNAAVLAVARLDGKSARELTPTQLTDLQLDIGERLHDTPGVSYVVPAGTSDDHTRLLFQIVPRTGPSDEATVALVDTLRSERDSILDETGVRSLGFAGQTVANIDMSTLLADALPTYLLIVVGISLVLLLLVFRSIVVPVLATAGFLLSIAAAFGSVVAVYQWGWLSSLFGVDHPGPVLSFLPTLAIGIVFGLAMDYQMFLVSGMREAWAHGHDARTAVRIGFSHGSRVVTAAALIMTAVFGSFVFSHSAMIRPIGFALATGVLFDAFVVRMTIMPAVMHLLGERAWYIPAWLDRILPDLDVEGARLLEKVGGTAPTADTAPLPH